jgi:polyferredoxin
MDACDHMMESVDLKKGLIGYKTEESIANAIPFHFSTRIIGYVVVLMILIGIMITLMLSRTDVETTVLRTPGVMFQTQPDGRLSNLYNYKVINKTNADFPVTFSLDGMDGEIKMVGNLDTVYRQNSLEGAMFVILDKSSLDGLKTSVKINVKHGDKLLETVKTNFMGPAN